MILLTLMFAVSAAADPIFTQPYERFANILDIEAVLNHSRNSAEEPILSQERFANILDIGAVLNHTGSANKTQKIDSNLMHNEELLREFVGHHSKNGIASKYQTCNVYDNLLDGEMRHVYFPPSTVNTYCQYIAFSPPGTYMQANCYLYLTQYPYDCFGFWPDFINNPFFAWVYCGNRYPYLFFTTANNYVGIAQVKAQGSNSFTYCTVKVFTPPPTTSNECDCGTQGPSRIVGGGPASVHEHPWQANLHTGSSAFCGATLISHEYVLTAAHCCAVVDPSSHSVTLGDHNHTTTGETTYEVQMGIAEVIMHENYNANTVDNDVCIIKLDSPVTYSDGVFPACLPHNLVDEDLTGRTCTVTGWGTTSEGGSQPEELHEVDVNIVSQTECRSAYGTAAITDNMICAAEDGSDSCQGDSGGPLVCSQDDKQVLVGVVSWGFGCARPNYPGVYARVTQYLDWINEKTSGSVCFPSA